MRERCSPAVLRAIETAQSNEESDGGTEMTAVALLRAMIDEEDGRAAQLIAKHGVVRDALLHRLSEWNEQSALPIDQILADAHALSHERDVEETVTSEFFLLALLQADPSLHRLLTEHGLVWDAFVREIIGEAPPALPMIEGIQLADLGETHAAGRIIDANANRARESLRLLDDYCRFVLDDGCLTAELKGIRHELAGLLDTIPSNVLLCSRETIHDVGTTIATAGEMERSSPRDVARINMKRLQESLRSLEEFGKMFAVNLAEGLERLRYRTYTLERAIMLGHDARQILDAVRLCVLLTGSQCTAALDWTIAEAAAGGASIFQLREKEFDDRRLLKRARDVRRWTRQAGALFIVNDRPEIARLSEADGVHLGQDDMPVHEARKIVGPDALIGVSTHDIGQVRQAILDGASYIGIGPTFSSVTKHFEALSGLEFIKQVRMETSLPAFAIGGVNLETIQSVVDVGARRVAVSSAIATADDPRMVARLLRQAIESN